MHRRPAQICARGCVLAVMLAVALQAPARSRDDCERLFPPESGQPGKDVVWIPTSDSLVTHMLRMAAVTPSDLVYDLGAGDGKIAIAAAKQFGARAVGVEYDPVLAKLAQCYAEAEGVASRVRIVQGDIFETDFSCANVVTLYLLPELNLRLRPVILRMKPGTRVVSHSFLMDDWEPDERSMTDDGQAFLWIVPARVGGTWTFRQQGGRDRFTVRLDQTFQQLTGRAGRQALTEARLNGPRIDLAFVVRGVLTRLAGHVDGDRIQAEVTRGNSTSTYVGTRT